MSSCAIGTEHQTADTGFLARLVLAVVSEVVLGADRFETDLLLETDLFCAGPVGLFGEVAFAVGVLLEALDLGAVLLVALSWLDSLASLRSRLLRWSLFSLGFIALSVSSWGVMSPPLNIRVVVSMVFGSQSFSSRSMAQAMTAILPQFVGGALAERLAICVDFWPACMPSLFTSVDGNTVVDEPGSNRAFGFADAPVKSLAVFD